LKNGSLYVHDGKLTLHLQHDRPKDPNQAGNWLPAPAAGGSTWHSVSMADDGADRRQLCDAENTARLATSGP
jgi:hypothetical protein